MLSKQFKVNIVLTGRADQQAAKGQEDSRWLKAENRRGGSSCWGQVQSPGANVIKLIKRYNKLECLSPAGFSNLILCFWVRPGACHQLEHLKALAWLENIRPYR